ncbi:MAG: hypothetical protein J7M14_00935, partial [Planctomycetes bacterium]|nr:hypothetical protein [Planctomycetota bacterium]
HDWIGISPDAMRSIKLTHGKLSYLAASAPVAPENLSTLAGPGAAWKAVASRPVKLAEGAVVTNGLTALAISSKTDYVLMAAMDAKGFARSVRIRFRDSAGKSCGPATSATLAKTPQGDALLELTMTCSNGKIAKASLGLNGSRELLGISAGPEIRDMTAECQFSLAIVPDRLGDDLIIEPRRSLGDVTLPWAPFIELLPKTETGVLAVITPSSQQKVRLVRNNRDATFSSIQIMPASKTFYLAPLSGKALCSRINPALSQDRKNLVAAKTAFCAAQWRIATISDGLAHSMMVNVKKAGEQLTAPAGAISKPPEFALAYLYGRTSRTSPDVVTPTDIIRDALGLEAAETLLDVKGIRGARVADRQTAYRDYRNVLKVLGWINSSRRKGVAEAIANHCEDIVAMLRGLDERIGEYETMTRRALSICRASAATDASSLAGARLAARISGKFDEIQSPSVPTQRVKAAGEKLKAAADRKAVVAKLPAYKHFCEIADLAFAQRSATISAYRTQAKNIRHLAGEALIAAEAPANLCENLRSLAGAALRNRYFIEADWCGEIQLNPSEVSYEKIKNW